jgi:hypothetical protein
VARLAREHFVVETSAYMHDPGLVPQGQVCTETMADTSEDVSCWCDHNDRAVILADTTVNRAET